MSAEARDAFVRERLRVRARRRALGVTTRPGSAAPRLREDTVGLALSGGGIRSATFAIGLLRALSDAKLIPYIDYLSTVSGGGYTGAFLCSHYVPGGWRGDIDETPDAQPAFPREDPFRAPGGAAAFEHLRQSGRHLLPGGTGDAIRLAAMMTRNWLAVQLVIGTTLLGFFLALKPAQAWLLRPELLPRLEAEHLTHLPPVFWPSQWLHGYPLSHWFVASPLWLPVALGGIVQAGFYWSYFLTRGDPAMAPSRLKHMFGPSLILALTLAALGIAMIGGGWPPGRMGAGARTLGTLVAATATIAVLAYAAAEWEDWRRTDRQLGDATTGLVSLLRRGARADPTRVSSAPRVQEDRVRTLLTNRSGTCLRLTLLAALLALLDSVAQTLYLRWDELVSLVAVGGGVALAIPLLRQALAKLPGLGSRGGGAFAQVARKFGRLLALLAGAALVAVLGTFWAVIAHFIAWRGGPIASPERWVPQGFGMRWADALPARDWQAIAALPAFDWLRLAMSPGPGWLWLTAALFAIGGAVIGVCFAFLNMSSFAYFYASRLRRAYLGASNAERRAARTPMNADHVNDDVALARYYAPGVLAPLHLIGVTINDTASGASNTVHRDRRGKPMVISPAGYMFQLDAAGDDRATLGVIPFGAPGVETLPLSAWIGISGAAASTGVGQFGSLGLSLLAGLANVRLGYWWDPGAACRAREPGWRNSVQARLADELIGRFPGTDGKRWYLTDGGHFEDSGAYELVRRRAAFIVVADCGADPDYGFVDLVTLTRRIRIDFDADLRFLDEAELDRALGTRTAIRRTFGSLRALGIGDEVEPRIGPYAALGRVRYAGPPAPGVADRRESTFLLIKPRVCGAEATDLVAYAKANPPFPQQTTLDQFFDEAQWESYFSLGRLIGEHLFRSAANPADARWRPAAMRPLPPAPHAAG